MARLMGGLGNQMFQYAAGVRLALKHGTTLKLDLSFLKDRTQRGITFRDFDLVIFQVTEETATAAEIRRFRRLADVGSRSVLERIADKLVKRRYFLESGAVFQPEVLNLPDETYLEGFFQNELYFQDVAGEIRERFKFQPEEAALAPATRKLADEIRAGESICLHVRRGDYLTNAQSLQTMGFCTLDYYKRALEALHSRGANGPVFVFSDDVAWCREHFSEAGRFTVVGDEHAGPRASLHFWLMSQCSHFVIPNSTFGWWAAWLGAASRKMVVRPQFWFQAPNLKDVDICPAPWIKVSDK